MDRNCLGLGMCCIAAALFIESNSLYRTLSGLFLSTGSSLRWNTRSSSLFVNVTSAQLMLLLLHLRVVFRSLVPLPVLLPFMSRYTLTVYRSSVVLPARSASVVGFQSSLMSCNDSALIKFTLLGRPWLGTPVVLLQYSGGRVYLGPEKTWAGHCPFVTFLLSYIIPDPLLCQYLSFSFCNPPRLEPLRVPILLLFAIPIPSHIRYSSINRRHSPTYFPCIIISFNQINHQWNVYDLGYTPKRSRLCTFMGDYICVVESRIYHSILLGLTFWLFTSISHYVSILRPFVFVFPKLH